MKLNRMMRVISILFLAGALLLTGNSPVWPAERLIADYGGTSGFQSPMWATKEGGFFSKYGLDVEIVMIAGGTQSIQALMSGSTQFSQASASAPIHSRLGGSDVIIVATSINKYPFSVVARPGIKTPAELAGKKLGVVRLGGSNEMALRKALSLWGIDPRSVTFLQMGEAASRLIALSAGSLDATVLAPPHTLKARNLKMTILADLNALPIYYPQSSIAVKESTLDRQPNLVKNFLKAYIEGIHLLRTNKAESLKILARYMRTSEKDIVEETYNYFTPMLSPVPRTNLEGIQEILNEEAKRLPAASRWKPTDLVRENLLDELEKEGFTQKFR